MGSSKFMRPKEEINSEGESNKQSVSPNLYVANCGPAVGLSYDTISVVFSQFGEVNGVFAADGSGTRVIVSFCDQDSAEAALNAFNGRHCSQLDGRFLHIRYSVPRPSPPVRGHDSVDVSLTAEEMNIPGLHLFHDFITAKEEEELLAAVDSRPWISLAKRRVQHHGYEFCYQTRNVDTTKFLGGLPSFVSPVLERISTSSLDDAASINLDQLTVCSKILPFSVLTFVVVALFWLQTKFWGICLQVNEYPPGVGLSPHIDTHSAFEDKIFSLSLAGPCIMEFRRYQGGIWQSDFAMSKNLQEDNPENSTNSLRKAIYLPPRSMLLLSGESRYAWHHYIPHHKVANKIN
ncbi:Alkylated DNA repair protein ALKBH8-like protein [Bienertia sinuspersici]